MDDELCYVKKSPLFYGIGQEELYTLLKCCGEERETFETGERIFRMGEAVDRVMILLKGGAVVEKKISGEGERCCMNWKRGIYLVRSTPVPDSGAPGQRDGFRGV